MFQIDVDANGEVRRSRQFVAVVVISVWACPSAKLPSTSMRGRYFMMIDFELVNVRLQKNEVDVSEFPSVLLFLEDVQSHLF